MKRFFLLILTAVIMLSLSACSGSERLKNMTIVQGLGIDTEGGKVTVTIQYLDLNKGSGKNDGISGSITSTVTASGNSIKTAVKNAGEKLPDALFFGQNKIIVISDDFEKSKAHELKTYLVKNKESRPDVLILKCRGKAADVIMKAQKDTVVPADSIYKQLKKLGEDVTVSEYLAGDELKYYPYLPD